MQKSASQKRPGQVLRTAKAGRESGRAGARRARPERMHSLSQRAYERLLGILLSGDLRPNDFVMERRLAVQLGVSRTPLREAIRRLEGERLLERQEGGAIVVHPMPVESFLNILSVRRLLEGEAARKAAGQVSREDLVRFRERLAGLGQRPHAQRLAELGRELHLFIAHSSGNPVLAQLIEDLGKRTRLFIRSFMRVAERGEQVSQEHLALIAALEANDGEAAKAAREEHIDHIRSYILERLASL